MLHFVLCDDNLILLDKLETILKDIFAKHNFNAEISFKSDDSDKIVEYMKHNACDVLLLDINLKSNKTGLEVAKEIREFKKNCYLIFTTGHLEYAMVAYKYKTFDYLAKPITYDRLDDTIVRLFDDINGQNKKYLKIDNKNTLVDESEVMYIKRDGMKLVFHTSTNNYETYSSFNKFQGHLPKNYIRCHKSFIANINQIKNIDPICNIVTFSDNSICDIGPKYKKDFMEVLSKNGIT